MGDFEKEKQAFEQWDNNDYKSNNHEIEFAENIQNKEESYIIGHIGYGFYGGYHSRDEEMTKLRAEIERKDKAIEIALKIEPRFGEPLQPYFDALKEVLKQALQNKEDWNERL